ncbi:helix-turn-helix transcriptional regulator, partial [Singulisphaera rosea]
MPESGPSATTSFGQLVSDARRRAGLTQDQLALRLGVHKQRVSGVERGAASISLRERCRWAA